jgi:hypothetical protein
VSDTTSTTSQLEGFQAQDAAPAHCGTPPCCGTGCAVCVLDYWEPNESENESESDTLAMLDAIEQAQSEARRMITDLSDPIE